MKIQLSIDERKHLFALTKLAALTQPEGQRRDFWLTVAAQLQPNSAESNFRRSQITLLIDITTTAVEQLAKKLANTTDVGQLVRGETLKNILETAKSRLEEKLKANPIEGENEDGIQKSQ